MTSSESGWADLAAGLRHNRQEQRWSGSSREPPASHGGGVLGPCPAVRRGDLADGGRLHR